jgi:hydroxymethylpyrimidine pyrophosphatase-like HAD family hydrolase
MRYLALAADYDGTLAQHGRVDAATLGTLHRFKQSGRKLLLVTGRELDELIEVFPEIGLFDRVVAENGALLYRPERKEAQALAEAPPAELVKRLTARGVDPISVGRVIVATWQPHEAVVSDVIRELSLPLDVIPNKRALMILPSGVNKATGLIAALGELGLSPESVVGVGDAENDQAFLELCGCSVAVSNALDAVKARVDWITDGDHGRGIVELIGRIMESDGPASPLSADQKSRA